MIMRPYVTVLPFGDLPLGMKKTVLLYLGMRTPNTWDSLPRSLANEFIHIYASGPFHNCLYSCDIPVMRSMTLLSLKCLHASCAVRICVARAYLEAVFSVLGCWRRGYCRSASVSVLVTLGDGAVMRLGDGALGVAMPGPVDSNLGCGDTFVAMVGRDVDSISWRFLMAYSKTHR